MLLPYSLGHLAVELIIWIKCQLVNMAELEDPFVFDFYLQSDLFSLQKITAGRMVSFVQAVAANGPHRTVIMVGYTKIQSYSNR